MKFLYSLICVFFRFLVWITVNLKNIQTPPVLAHFVLDLILN